MLKSRRQKFSWVLPSNYVANACYHVTNNAVTTLRFLEAGIISHNRPRMSKFSARHPFVPSGFETFRVCSCSPELTSVKIYRTTHEVNNDLLFYHELTGRETLTVLQRTNRPFQLQVSGGHCPHSMDFDYGVRLKQELSEIIDVSCCAVNFSSPCNSSLLIITI
ncbi:hypothetical protein Y032_0349g3206 [Ancylostoma ceylanicum]|uniref:Uncharacterized protein n=1 Tax=Ancylostoma ceylanicum TaxID=53326 RepID=A0A016RX22_9BILA|nr:hypothetical protein Y032_0349g3206 [Ancylostoma ceylanicum]